MRNWNLLLRAADFNQKSFLKLISEKVPKEKLLMKYVSGLGLKCREI